MQILCIALVFSLFAWIISDCVLIPAKREKKVFLATCISAVLNITINLIFIPHFSENAAAFSTVVAEGSMMIINFYYARDVIGDIIKSKSFLNNLITAVLGSLGIILVCYICRFGWHSLILRTFVSIVLSVLMYISILVLFKNEIALKIVNKYISRYKSN